MFKSEGLRIKYGWLQSGKTEVSKFGEMKYKPVQ